MREFECKQSGECRNLCDVLSDQGITTHAEDDSCVMPVAFQEANGAAHMQLDTEPKNIALAKHVAAELLNVLSRRDYEPRNLDELKLAQAEVLGARFDLWGAMTQSAKDGRTFTVAEKNYYEGVVAEALENQELLFSNLSSEEIVQAQAAFDSDTLRSDGIVYTDQAIEVMNALASNYMDTRASLLVGDKGIAKTSFARRLGRLTNNNQEPFVLSGRGDQMSDEIIGRFVPNPQTGIFEFEQAKGLDAIEQGKFILYDEINLNDQTITMCLQDVLLRKPGEVVSISASSKQEIPVANGFGFVATANEASDRYTHRVKLDPAFRERFDVIPVSYPDVNTVNPLEEIPVETMRLAMAAVCNERGVPSPHVAVSDVERFARLAHVTQRLYSTPLENSGMAALDAGATTTGLIMSDRPVMTDCITPRTMITTLLRCADGNKPGFTLNDKIEVLIQTLDQGGAATNSMWARKAMENLTYKEL